MLFFESKEAFLEAFDAFKEEIGRDDVSDNFNCSSEKKWLVNLVNISNNRAFTAFVEAKYNIDCDRYVKGKKILADQVQS